MTVARKSLFESPAGLAIIGGVVLIVSIVTAVVIVTLLGGSGLRDDDDDVLDLVPGFVGPAPDIGRSDAADLLASTSFEDMTPEDIDLVVAEVQRVFGDATFRARDREFVAIDVVRQGGETRAWRQYRIVETPGDPESLAEITVFYCPGRDEATWTEYRFGRDPIKSDEAAPAPKRKEETPFQRILTALDWSEPKDLGYAEIGGRQVHGVEVPFTAPSGTRIIETEYWFDVENARLMRRVEGTGLSDYVFDYQQVPKLETPGEFADPPCYDEIVPG